MPKHAPVTRGEIDQIVEKIRQITVKDNDDRDRRIRKLEDNSETIVRMDERTKAMKDSVDSIVQKLDDEVLMVKEFETYKINNDKKVDRVEKALIGVALFILAAVGTMVLNFFLRGGGQ